MAKKRQTLDTTFSCLFCNHENCVSVELRKKEGIGALRCKTCGQHFETNINCMFLPTSANLDLSAPIDVYSDWIDACDAVAREDGNSQAQKTGRERPGSDDDDEY